MRYNVIAAAAGSLFFTSLVGATGVSELSSQQSQAVEKAWAAYSSENAAVFASITSVIYSALPTDVLESVIFNPDSTEAFLATTVQNPPTWVTYLPADAAAAVTSIFYKEQAIEYSVLGIPEPTALAAIESKAGAAPAARPTNAIGLNAAGMALGAAGIAAALL